MTCKYCDEEITESEERRDPDATASSVHIECMVRMVAGSVAHQRRRCLCFGGDEGDPPGVTLRQAARAALGHASIAAALEAGRSRGKAMSD